MAVWPPLRARLFVDLFGVVRHSVRASVESYSIKRLEPFYGFARQAALPDANVALANLQANLELNDAPSISDAIKSVVRAYNEDDCKSTAELLIWLRKVAAENKIPAARKVVAAAPAAIMRLASAPSWHRIKKTSAGLAILGGIPMTLP